MDQDGSLLESGLLVGGGHLVAHVKSQVKNVKKNTLKKWGLSSNKITLLPTPNSTLVEPTLRQVTMAKKTKRQHDKKTKRQAHLEAGDDDSVVRQCCSCQQAGSCNSLVLNFNWNMKMR